MLINLYSPDVAQVALTLFSFALHQLDGLSLTPRTEANDFSSSQRRIGEQVFGAGHPLPEVDQIFHQGVFLSVSP